jgi:hypothetical protein
MTGQKLLALILPLLAMGQLISHTQETLRLSNLKTEMTDATTLKLET